MMKLLFQIVITGISLLNLVGCKDNDDVIPARKYEFSSEEIKIGEAAADIEIAVVNADERNPDWNLCRAEVTDDVCGDGSVELVENECITTSDGFTDYSPVFQWGWFRIEKVDDKLIKIHVDENKGGQRKVIVFIGAIMDSGAFTIIQEGAN